jgi:hypothetical protein
MGLLIPCTSATLALEKAIPAWVEASIIASRASRSVPSAYTRRRFLPMAPIAVRDMPSEKQFALRLT